MNNKLLTTLALIAVFAVGTAFGTSVSTPGETLTAASSSSLKIPHAPTNLTAKIVTKGGKQVVQLNWKDNSSNERYFQIKRKVGSGAYSTLGSSSKNDKNYDDKKVGAPYTYTYRVRAIGPALNSSYTNTVTVTLIPPTSNPTTGPTVPTTTSPLGTGAATGAGVGPQAPTTPTVTLNPSLKLTGPTMGANFKSLTNMKVTWTSTDVPSNTQIQIIGKFKQDNGNVKDIVFATSANDGSEEFTIPSAWPNGTYNALVIKTTVNGKEVSAVSSLGFKITPKD